MGKVKNHLLTEEDTHLYYEDGRGPTYAEGHYFSDETGDFNGPYKTKALAREALHKYIKDNFP